MFKQKAQGVVEFALVLPLFLLLIIIAHFAMRLFRYPLIPLLDTPFIMYFLKNTNTRNNGSDTIATAAIWTG